MAVYRNTSGGTLVLPGGKEIPAGGEADLSEADTKNVGVSKWIDGGSLAKKPGRKPVQKDEG